ncbi:MAG: GGDEF domain-containing protein [Rhodocyclaceae bacterium]|nr:GGDEF domain-containing protein [Rhodocyclaceae bacterium]
MSYIAGSRAVDAVSVTHLREMVGRIGQAVDRHIVGSAAVLEAAFPEGVHAPRSLTSDLDELRTRFWIATSLHRDPNNYVYYGNQQGQFIGLYRHSEHEAELRFKEAAGDTRTIFRFSGIDGYLDFSAREKRVYNPRERPWYLAGQTAPSHTWTEVYIDFTTFELVATRARRVLDEDGAFAGVVATDVSLKDLNEFVGSLKISEHGLAFIIEPGGLLIASTVGANVRLLPDGTSARVNASDSEDPLVRRAYEVIREAGAASGGRLEGPVARTLEGPLGDAVYIAFDRIKDDAGLDWITAVVVPRSDFMHGVSDNLLQVGAAGLTAAVLALVIGMRVVEWVARDLRRVADAARRLGEGESLPPLGIERQDEIGDLARSFEVMQYRLRTDRLTGLANRETFTRELERRIGRRLASGRKGDGFAVLFVDLNHFKDVNDALGHDAGDSVLVEVAQRIAGQVRSGDLVARYAGDEFVVLLDSVDNADEVQRVRAEIEMALAAPYAGDREVTLSRIGFGGAVGMALYPHDGTAADELVRHADREMYDRKFASRSPLSGRSARG